MSSCSLKQKPGGEPCPPAPQPLPPQLCPVPSQVHEEDRVTPAAVAGQLYQVLGVCSRQLQGVHDVQVVLVGAKDGLNPQSHPPHPEPRCSQKDQGYTWASLTVSATLRPCTRTFMGSM